MAVNTNKRVPVKHIRDGAKSAYDKKSECYICNTKYELELHHTHSLTLLLERWAARKGYALSTDEEVLAVRDEFIQEHKLELYEAVYTLCATHHRKLHSIYGKAPPLNSADKQAKWVEIQKSKHDGTYVAPSTSLFGAFTS
jgi:hypothetical protein